MIWLKNASENVPPVPIPPFFPFIWLDGLDASTFTLFGTAVNGWQNKGTGGGTFTKPYATTRACSRTPDGVNFDNANHVNGAVPNDLSAVLECSMPLAAAPNWTYFAVISNITSVFEYRTVLSRRAVGTTKYHSMSLQRQTGQPDELVTIQNDIAGNSGRARALSPTALNWTAKQQVTSVFGSATLTATLNSVPVTGTAAVGNPRDTIVGSSLLTLGGQRKTVPTVYDTFINSFKGYIHEVIAYNSALSAPDIASVNTYLSNRWGL